MKKEPVFLLGGILTGLLAALPFLPSEPPAPMPLTAAR
jgi:hypothetical protein